MSRLVIPQTIADAAEYTNTYTVTQKALNMVSTFCPNPLIGTYDPLNHLCTGNDIIKACTRSGSVSLINFAAMRHITPLKVRFIIAVLLEHGSRQSLARANTHTHTHTLTEKR